jgi:hypothetical protein
MSDKIPGDILEDQSVPGAPTTVRRGPPKVVEPVAEVAPIKVPVTVPEPEAAFPFGVVVGADEGVTETDNYDEEATNDGEDE